MLEFGKSLDPISLFDALYDLERTRKSWCDGVIGAAGAAFDQGVGAAIVCYDVSGSAPSIEMMRGFKVPEGLKQIGIDSHSDPELFEGIVRGYRTDLCVTLDEQNAELRMRAGMEKLYETVGIRDHVIVNGVDPSRSGCALFLFSPEVIRLGSGERQLLTRIATHLSAAYRLHRRFKKADDGTVALTVDAVLTPSGKVEHAELSASSNSSLSSLAGAVKMREWARTRTGRRDSEKSTDAWKPLVSGRWSLVDSYERNGRRYITACENTPAPAGLESLTPRESQVGALAELGRSNKVIAYELGLGHSTVRVLLARAASKLGVSTRVDLINRIRLLRANVSRPE